VSKPVPDLSPLSDYGLIAVADLAARTGWSVRSLVTMIGHGKLPACLLSPGAARVTYLVPLKAAKKLGEPKLAGRPKKGKQ
jgi:hypothetical protein